MSMQILKAKHPRFEYCLIRNGEFMQWENIERLKDIVVNLIHSNTPFSFHPEKHFANEPEAN